MERPDEEKVRAIADEAGGALRTGIETEGDRDREKEAFSALDCRERSDLWIVMVAVCNSISFGSHHDGTCYSRPWS